MNKSPLMMTGIMCSFSIALATAVGCGSSGDTVVNDTPVATSQEISVPYNAVTAITLTGGDADHDILSFEIVSQPASGQASAVDAKTGIMTYTSNTGYDGFDEFTFRVFDGTDYSAPATVRLTIAVAPSIGDGNGGSP